MSQDNTTQGAKLFKELEAILEVVKALGYDTENITVDHAFRIRRAIKDVVLGKIED